LIFFNVCRIMLYATDDLDTIFTLPDNYVLNAFLD